MSDIRFTDQTVGLSPDLAAVRKLLIDAGIVRLDQWSPEQGAINTSAAQRLLRLANERGWFFVTKTELDRGDGLEWTENLEGNWIDLGGEGGV